MTTGKRYGDYRARNGDWRQWRRRVVVSRLGSVSIEARNGDYRDRDSARTVTIRERLVTMGRENGDYRSRTG